MRKLMMIGVLGVLMSVTTLAHAQEVSVTKNGKKYHHTDCRLIQKKNPITISREDAMKKGLKPCKVCFKEEAKLENSNQENQLLGKK